ncbi:hypothetical protein NDA11_004081 [Ustilago hordei]|uniref:EamA domain-containing protein n=1 Tax=Ustilago hordei TaxID=120017 RepID=I2FUP7_USTHO|nr:uncharacterized protein UHO2_07228 [Ustilago hordei]KAJ1040830.1 hypothetical protein NDA10_005841 [Ustilago hordei]KAJ1576350.1 hypothetical protein NDA12_002537 [Ustilago hordei]KAJ1577742.1 hypothetical protein NDA15_001684 [Ustilago hordei]KAJ1596489.1 hypothetical protein NDA11_004081 [Ustilago hordei]KAJ1598767.1 hypothetical protein NDA14_000847 [Ustilago hordei]
MSAAPAGRVQPALGFNPASYGSVVAGSCLLEPRSMRSERRDSIDQDENSQQSDDHATRYSQSSATEEAEEAEEAEEDASYTLRDDAASILSDFACIFHPNEYMAAQQRLEEIDRRSEYSSYDEERAPILPGSYGARRFSGAAVGSAWFKAPTQGGHVSGISIRQALVDRSTKPGSNLGLVLIAVSQVCYSTMNLFVKLLDERQGQQDGQGQGEAIGALEIVGVECLIIWIGCLLAMCMAKTKNIILGPPGTRLLLLARGMFGFASTLALYISLQTLSLSDATVITFLSPLATGFLAYVLLHEPFTVRERIAGVLSLAGVTLIARPSFLFGSNAGQGAPEDGDIQVPPASQPGSASEAGRIVGILVALSGVVLMAGAWVCLRGIGKRASTYHSISYFALCSWLSSFVAMYVLKEPFVIPSSTLSLLLLLGVGLFSLLAQVFQTLGLQRESAGRAATMSYLQIIFALFWQLVLFRSVPDLVSIVGSLVILASGAWVALSKQDGSAAMH